MSVFYFLAVVGFVLLADTLISWKVRRVKWTKASGAWRQAQLPPSVPDWRDP